MGLFSSLGGLKSTCLCPKEKEGSSLEGAEGHSLAPRDLPETRMCEVTVLSPLGGRLWGLSPLRMTRLVSFFKGL